MPWELVLYALLMAVAAGMRITFAVAAGLIAIALAAGMLHYDLIVLEKPAT